MSVDFRPVTSTRRRAQVIRITTGLVVTGAACGAAVGATLAIAMFALGPGGPSRYDIPLGLVFGGGVGAVVGALTAPLFGWTVLRSVPLGRAIGLAALGTFIGGAFGVLTQWHPLATAVTGLVAASLLARARAAALPKTEEHGDASVSMLPSDAEADTQRTR